MKSEKWKFLFSLLLLLCVVLFVIGKGMYIEFVDNSQDDDGTINWKKGVFRLVIVISIIVGILGGVLFAKKGELADEDDGDPPPKHFTDPKSAFLCYFSIFFGFVWLAYFIVESIIIYTLWLG